MIDIRHVRCSSCGGAAHPSGPYGEDDEPLCASCWREYEGFDEKVMDPVVVELLVCVAVVLLLVLAVVLFTGKGTGV